MSLLEPRTRSASAATPAFDRVVFMVLLLCPSSQPKKSMKRSNSSRRRPSMGPLVVLLRMYMEGSTARGNEGVLQSLRYYERLRQNLTTSRFGNLDSAIWENNRSSSTSSSISSGSVQDDGFEKNVQFCHIVDINRHTIMNRENQIVSAQIPMQYVAAVLLAQEHLNTGNGRVVEEVAGLNQRCNIRFSAEFLDTQGLENYAADQLYTVLTRSELPNSSNHTQQQPKPCAFLGAWRSAVSVPLALLTSMEGYPQFSVISTADQLDDKQLFPLFGRMIPSTAGSVGPLLDFLLSLSITHVGVVHTDDNYGMSYMHAFKERAEARGITIQTVGFADDTDDFTSPVTLLKQTNYRFFVGMIRHLHYSRLMEEAYRQGIAGTGEHNWLLAASIYQKVNSSPEVQNASIGAMQFIPKDPDIHVGNYPSFVEALSELGTHRDDLEYLQSKLPTYPDEPSYVATFSTETLQTESIVGRSALFYDTMIALGLGACHAIANFNNGVLDGKHHFQSTVTNSFVGASGKVELDSVTGSRKASTMSYEVINYVVDDEDELSLDDETVTGASSFSLKSIEALYYNNQQWNSLEPLTFNDGTTNLPLSLPQATIHNMHTIGLGWRITGFILAGALISASILCSAWTMYYRQNRVVRASQPIFLMILCVGTFFCGVSLIPLSIDDEIVGEQGAHMACLCFPWFFSVGWVTAFSTLFVKTRRVVRIFNTPRFRRVAVQPKDVLVPIILLLGANVLVLTVWTFYGLNHTWERTYKEFDEFGRPTESFGRCQWHRNPAFLNTLLVIDIGSLLFAIRQAWAARKISTEYSESEWIAKSVFVMFIISFVGVPIVTMAEENTRSLFFVLTAMVFLTGMILLGFIFFPKMCYVWDGKASQKKNGSSFYVYRPSVDTRNVTSNLTTGNERSLRSSAGQTGVLLLDHPRIRDRLEEKIDKLTSEFRKLKAINAELLQEKNGISNYNEDKQIASVPNRNSNVGPNDDNNDIEKDTHARDRTSKS